MQVKNRKSQAWSADVMIAAVVFLLGVIIFFYIITVSTENKKIEELSREADTISNIIVVSEGETADDCSFVVGSRVDEGKLAACSNYDQLKTALGARNDFCIHFEDKDGNIIDIDEDPVTVGIGSPGLVFTYIDPDDGSEVQIPCSPLEEP